MPAGAGRSVLWLRAWLWLCASGSVAGTAALSWLMLSYLPAAGPREGSAVTLAAPAELGVDALSVRLADEGIVRHPVALRAWMHLMDAAPRLRTTKIVIRPGASVAELLPALVEGRGNPVFRLTFPEGFDRHDFAAKLADFGVVEAPEFIATTARPDLRAALHIDAPSLEGRLFPDTYELRVPSHPKNVLKRLVATYDKRIGQLFTTDAEAVARLKQDLGFDEADILTLASIVEKEARLARERPIIAGVFLNRLRDPKFRPHRLQADPTVAYGCRVAPESAPSCAEFDGKRVTPAMVRDAANPYNTYRIEGLPPGPICSPGVDAVKAVLRATEHDYYYFVAAGDGSHTFSASLDDHNRAIHGERHGG